MANATFRYLDSVSEMVWLDMSVVHKPSYYIRTLKALSVVGTISQIKPIAGLFRAKKRFSLSLDGDNIDIDHETGFHVSIARLPAYRAAHLTVKARDSRVAYGDPLTAMKSFLFSDQISTPIMEHWVPWITQYLRANHNLVQLSGYRCEAWLCNFDSDDMDKIVELGIQRGEIAIIAPEVAPNGA